MPLFLSLLGVHHQAWVWLQQLAAGRRASGFYPQFPQGDAESLTFLCIDAGTDQIFGMDEVEKDSFVALPGRGGHSGLMPSNPSVPTWGRQ